MDGIDIKSMLLIGFLDKNGSSCLSSRTIKSVLLKNTAFQEIIFPESCYANINNNSKIKDSKAFELANTDEISFLSINIEVDGNCAHDFVNHLYNLIIKNNVQKILLLASIYPSDVPRNFINCSFFETSFNSNYITDHGKCCDLNVDSLFLNYFFQVAIVKQLPLNVLWVIGNKCKIGLPNLDDDSLTNIEIFNSELRKYLNQDFDIEISKNLELKWQEDNLLYN